MFLGEMGASIGKDTNDIHLDLSPEDSSNTPSVRGMDMRRLQHQAYPFRHLKYEASPVVALTYRAFAPLTRVRPTPTAESEP